MGFSPNLEDRERSKFVESPTRATETAIEVVIGNASEISGGSSATGLLAGVQYDYGTVEYPSVNQEIYKFYNGGSAGTLTATVTLNYSDSTKENLINFEVVK